MLERRHFSTNLLFFPVNPSLSNKHPTKRSKVVSLISAQSGPSLPKPSYSSLLLPHPSHLVIDRIHTESMRIHTRNELQRAEQTHQRVALSASHPPPPSLLPHLHLARPSKPVHKNRRRVQKFRVAPQNTKNKHRNKIIRTKTIPAGINTTLPQQRRQRLRRFRQAAQHKPRGSALKQRAKLLHRTREPRVFDIFCGDLEMLGA